MESKKLRLPIAVLAATTVGLITAVPSHAEIGIENLDTPVSNYTKGAIQNFVGVDTAITAEAGNNGEIRANVPAGTEIFAMVTANDEFTQVMVEMLGETHTGWMKTSDITHEKNKKDESKQEARKSGNITAGTTEEATVLGKFAKGDTLTVLAVSGGWVNVSKGDVVGWTEYNNLFSDDQTKPEEGEKDLPTDKVEETTEASETPEATDTEKSEESSTPEVVEEEATEEAVELTEKHVVGYSDLFKEPNSDAEKVGYSYAGQTVKAGEVDGDFTKVVHESGESWIYSSELSDTPAKEDKANALNNASVKSVDDKNSEAFTLNAGDSITVLGVSGEESLIKADGDKIGWVNTKDVVRELPENKDVDDSDAWVKGTQDVKALPISTSETIAEVTNEDKLRILETAGDYSKVEFGEITGYVKTSKLKDTKVSAASFFDKVFNPEVRELALKEYTYITPGGDVIPVTVSNIITGSFAGVNLL